MIVKEEFLNKIRYAFNLNIYEAKIWSSLLSRGIASAGELADISGVPRSRSYDVLESLEKRGFVIIKLGKPIKYIAVEPKEILKRVKDGIKQKIDYQLNTLDNVKGTTMFKEVELLYKQGISHVGLNNLSGALRGRANIKGHLDHILSNAEKSISIMTSPTGFIRKINDHKKLLKKLNDSGVRIKIATQLNEETKKLAREVKEFADVKHMDNLSARFSIVDGKDIMFMIEDDKKVHENYDTGIWVNSPFFASAMEQMFNSAWNGKQVRKGKNA